MTERGRERVLERETDYEWGNSRGKVSDRHTPRVFRIEHKTFIIQVDQFYYGGGSPNYRTEQGEEVSIVYWSGMCLLAYRSAS